MNLTVSSATPSRTPFQIWYDLASAPNLAHLQSFGAYCFARIPTAKRSNKLSPRGEPSRLLGYLLDAKGYLLLLPDGRTTRSTFEDVVFAPQHFTPSPAPSLPSTSAFHPDRLPFPARASSPAPLLNPTPSPAPAPVPSPQVFDYPPSPSTPTRSVSPVTLSPGSGYMPSPGAQTPTASYADAALPSPHPPPAPAKAPISTAPARVSAPTTRSSRPSAASLQPVSRESLSPITSNSIPKGSKCQNEDITNPSDGSQSVGGDRRSPMQSPRNHGDHTITPHNVANST
ncbi:hypothetical protein EDD86DRAFT_212439 [Gorgonomyces haynaldii]|nr:hypothetical protein EDD86DRAFT_212439 [Gorgonomyces haynaldii]